MKQNKNYVLYNFDGDWMSKKSVYLLNSKIERTYKQYIKVKIKNGINDLYKYDITHIQQYYKSNDLYGKISFYLSDIIQKNNKIIKFYKLKFIKLDLLKLQIKLQKNKLVYTEYIYYIHNNLRVSISLLKVQKKYISIAFTSYIKLFNQLEK
uniref:Uncharacterized protein n=1 Tax=Dictyurus purpurascens TaxID=189649 RepID=A0A4D6WXV9_9FLOR|nr:hypothetical protein [Dictyurus purpurascens]